MPIIDWLDSYSVRVEELDQNHKQIVDMVNRLHDSILCDRVDETVTRVVKDLIGYTRSHFALEETIMKKLNFPDLSCHQCMHQEFSDKVAALLKPGAQTTVFELMAILREKLVKHIMHEDQKFGTAVNRGIKSTDSTIRADRLGSRYPG